MLQLEGRGEAVSLWTGLPVCVGECVFIIYATIRTALAAFKTDTNGRHRLKCVTSRLPACDLSPLVHRSVSHTPGLSLNAGFPKLS